NAGATVGIFVHDPESCEIPGTGHVVSGAVEALAFADFVVTTSEDSKASIAGSGVARQPPLPVDVVPLAQEGPSSRSWHAVAEELLHAACKLARRVPPFDGVAAIALPANRYLRITSDATVPGETGGCSASVACISGWGRPEPWGVWANQRRS